MRAHASAVLAVVACLAIAACGSSRNEAEQQTTSAQPQTPPTTETRNADDREQAPALVGPSLDGERVELADFRGRPVLINVWSSW
jgi:hypothetical protein